jgi:transglutaminase-like putative cysteine protease
MESAKICKAAAVGSFATRVGLRSRGAALVVRAIRVSVLGTFVAFALGSAWASDGADVQPVRLVSVSSETDLKADGQFVQTVDQQIKVQTQAGLQQAGQMAFSFSASLQRFEVLQAQTRKSDGRVVEVRPESIFTRDLPASTGAPMFADIKVVVIVFPELAVGDSVFARVRIEQAQPMFPGHYSGLAFLMPHLLVDQARFVLRAPKSLKLRAINEGYAERRGEGADFVEYEWTAGNAVVEPIEQGSVAPVDYSRRVTVSTFGDFSEFARAYSARAEEQAQPTAVIKALADEITSGEATAAGQARLLYDWVTQNVRYVGIALGMGAVVPHAAEQVLRNRYGDCKDKVTLLTALLAAKGIEARTAIVNAGTSYWTSSLPLLPNFNHVILYVPSLVLWLDPTATVTPYGRLPHEVQGKLVVLVPSGELRRTPVDLNTENVTIRRVRYVIQDDGTIKGTTDIEARGLRAEGYRLRAREMSPDQRAQYMRDLTTGSRYTGEGTVSFIGLERRTDSVQVKADYVLRGGIDWPGAGSFEVPAGFRGGEPMATQVQRNATALKRPRVGHAETLIEEYEIQLPAKMRVVALPQNVALRNEAASYEANYRRQGQTIFVTRKLVDLFSPPVKEASLFKAQEEKSGVIARDLRAQVVYRSE